MMENMGYRQEKLRDIVEKEAEREEPTATNEEVKEQQQGQQQSKNSHRMMMSDVIRLQK